MYVDEKIQGRILHLLSIGKYRPSKINKKKKEMDEIEKIFVCDTTPAPPKSANAKTENIMMTNILLSKSHQK